MLFIILSWMNNKVPHYCFCSTSVKYHKLNEKGKPIYIFANHATAIRAWYAEKSGSSLNLITFDEHTDTRPPLCSYANSYFGGKNERILPILEHIKTNLSEDLLKRLLTPRGYLKETEMKSYGAKPVDCRLKHDEHITTALYLGIIDTAYICCHKADCSVYDHKEDEYCETYERIKSLSKAYPSSYPTDEENTAESCFNELEKYSMRNISNFIIDKLYSNGLNTQHPYILDIDLDYFVNIDALAQPIERYNRFGELVRNAQVITIATEPKCFKESQNIFNKKAKEYNSLCTPEDGEVELRHKNSSYALDKLLSIIRYSLNEK